MLRQVRVVLFAVISSHLTIAASVPSLKKLWAVNLGPATNEHAIYRSAVCGDGSFYLSDGNGRVVRLSPQGEILSDALHAELANVLAFTCAKDGSLVTAGKELRLYKPNGGAVKLTSSSPRIKGFHPYAITSGREGTFNILGLNLQMDKFIFTIDELGNVITAFGDLPQQSSVELSRHAGVNGSLIWNPVLQTLIVIPESPYEVRSYDGFGQYLSSAPQRNSGFSPMQLDARQNVVPSDRIIRGALLPDGNLIVEVVKRQVNPILPTIRSSAFLEILDERGDVKATGISVTGFGQLQGTSSAGDLYFYLISAPTGINIIKASLQAE